MKLTKKLIPALGMLVLSASMLVTSTFAWFSMNDRVEAKGMTVTAKAEQVYLQIVNDATAFDNKQAQTSATATNSGYTTPDGGGEATPSTFLPITVASGLTNANKTLTNVTAGENGLLSNAIKWYVNYSNDPAAYKNDNNEYSEVTVDTAEQNLKPYCLINTFYVRLNPATNVTTTSSPLRSEIATAFATGDPMAETVSVLVVCGNYAQLWKQTSLNAWASTGNALTDGGFANAGTNNGGHEVKVYIFFDGENANCTTNNVKTTNYAVTVNFTVAAKTKFAK